MSTEANKAVARRYFDEFLNQGKGVGGEDLFAPTYRSHFPGSPGVLDKQERDHLTSRLFAAFPDAYQTLAVDVHYSAWGKVRSFFYKPPPVAIDSPAKLPITASL